MPTYRNVTSKRQILNNKAVEPGETICSLNYIDENAANLLKVDEKPLYNPIILSTVVVASKSVSIPQKDSLGKPVEKYAIHFCVQQGTVKINYNSADNEPGLLLYQGAKWNIRCFERTVDKIIVQGVDTPFTLYLIVEKLQ